MTKALPSPPRARLPLTSLHLRSPPHHLEPLPWAGADAGRLEAFTSHARRFPYLGATSSSPHQGRRVRQSASRPQAIPWLPLLGTHLRAETSRAADPAEKEAFFLPAFIGSSAEAGPLTNSAIVQWMRRGEGGLQMGQIRFLPLSRPIPTQPLPTRPSISAVRLGPRL